MSTRRVPAADHDPTPIEATLVPLREPVGHLDDPLRAGELLREALARPASTATEQSAQRGAAPAVVPDRGGARIGLEQVRAALRPRSLTVLASRPSEGKSALALGLATDMARTDQAQVALACLEMSKPEVAMRLMAATASVDLQRLRTGRLGDSDWVRLTRHLGILADLNVVFINTNFGLSLTDLVEHCLKLAQRRRLDLLVVDYIQLLTAEPEAPGAFCDPHEALGRLKHLAVELDLAVVAVSQLSRRAGERGDQPPADRPPWAPAQPSRSPTSSDSFTPVAPRGHGRRTSSGPHSSSSCATTSARLGWSPCGSTARTAGSPTFS